jgi:CBS domain-containing protein
MNVSQILSDKNRDVISVTRDTSVFEISKLFGEHKIGAVPIIENGKLCGIISERDVVQGIADKGADALSATVDSLMTQRVFTCARGDTVQQLMALMTTKKVRHIPVVDDGKLVGIVSIGDVVKERLQETEQEAEALKEYIAMA